MRKFTVPFNDHPVVGMTAMLLCGVALVCALWVPEISLEMPDYMHHVCMVGLFLCSVLYLCLLLDVIFGFSGTRLLLVYGVFILLPLTLSVLTEPLLRVGYAKWADTQILSQAKAGNSVARLLVELRRHEEEGLGDDVGFSPEWQDELTRLLDVSLWFWPERSAFYGLVLINEHATAQERDDAILACWRLHLLSPDKGTRESVDETLLNFQTAHKPLMKGLSERSLNALSRAAERVEKKRKREER